MLIPANLNTARQVAFRRALGARDAANAVEARSDEMPGDVAKQLIKYHADGFNALITDAITDAEVLTPGELRAEIQARMEKLASPPRNAAEKARIEQELTERIRDEGTDKKEFADEAVQMHTGALNQLDAVMENDRSRLRRAASLNRIVRRMQNGQATPDEFAFFHDPGDAHRQIADRTPFDLGYGILSKRPELVPAPDAAEVEQSARRSPQPQVSQTIETLRALDPHERIEQLTAYRTNPDNPLIFSFMDNAAIHDEIAAAREELAQAPLHGSSPAPSGDASPVSSGDVTPERSGIRNDSPPPLQRRNAVRVSRQQPNRSDDIIGLSRQNGQISAIHSDGSVTRRNVADYESEHPANQLSSANLDWSDIPFLRWSFVTRSSN